jgi:rubrerythrin
MKSIADIPEAVCPVCGGYGRGYHSNNQVYYICDSCGYHGPKVHTESILSVAPRVEAKNMFENKGEIK